MFKIEGFIDGEDSFCQIHHDWVNHKLYIFQRPDAEYNGQSISRCEECFKTIVDLYVDLQDKEEWDIVCREI